MAKTFLDFVNQAISEAKVSLDPLDASNFANPPRTILYSKFKDWVNRSYKELLVKRNEWHFQRERAVVTIGPRIHIFSPGGYVPVAGDILRGQTSQFEVEVLSVESFENDELTTPVEFTLDILLPEGQRVADFAVGELIDKVGPTEQIGVAQMEGPGFYNGRSPTFQVDRWSITLFDSPSDIEAPGTNTAGAQTLTVVPWQYWVQENAMWSNSGGRPEFVTQNPQGYFAVFPHPEKTYTIEIYYNRGPQEMVDHDDIPIGMPERYEDYILWKTVEEFSDYDQNTRLYARANKKVEMYESWLERDEMQTVTIGPNRFYRKRY